jgi:two-component system, OmpR family, sensor histidine kinase VicK
MLLIVVAMQIIGVYFIRELEDTLETEFNQSLDSSAELLESTVEQVMKKQSEITEEDNEYDMKREIGQLLNDFTFSDVQDLIVVDKEGLIIGAEGNGENLVGQVSKGVLILRARLGHDVDEVFINDDGHRVRVLVIPVRVEKNGNILGAIYLQASMEGIKSLTNTVNNILAQGTLFALAITGVLGVVLARTVTKPMADMRKQALVMARGDFTRKVKVYGEDEIGQLAMSFNDLTQKLQEANAITESERTKLRSVLAYMTDGVIATDRDGMVILLNDRAEEMLQTSRHQALGKMLVNLLGISEDLTWDDLNQEHESRLLDFSTSDRNYILRASFSVIQKEDGPINGIITVLHDVTEQEQIEHERKEFVFNVSHELRTPLTTMRSYLEALADGAWQDENLAPKFLDVTQNETERMIRLVTDLLQLSKMDSKDFHLKLEHADIIQLLDSVIDRFDMSTTSHHIFERKYSVDPIYVSIDQDKLTQVLDNIISNAIKYSPDGGVIQINANINNRKVFISVSDEGVGIPKQNVAKIFERFYRVDKARSRNLGGTGLGLAIAKEVIHAHGGEIWAESEWGKGTKILFTLPLNKFRRGD